MPKHISSIKDPKIILCRELLTAKARNLHKKFLLYGVEQIKWAMNCGMRIDFIITTEGQIPKEFANYEIYETSEGILKKATEPNYLIPIIAVGSQQDSLMITDEFVIVLDRVLDFGNIGTIIRTANGFGLKNFVATNNDFDPFQRKVIDASRGTVFQSTFQTLESEVAVILSLKAKGYQIVATSPHAKTLQSQILLEKKPVALIIGNETDGISQELMNNADICIQIPMYPSVESINVGVAAGISMYELKFKMVLLMLKEKIFDSLGRNINVTGQLIQSVFDVKIRRVTNLNGMQVILLMILHCDQVMSLEQIGNDTGTFGKDLTTFLEPLMSQSLIVQNGNNYSLTGKGSLFLAEIWPVVEQAHVAILQDLKPEERVLINDLLKKIQATCLRLIHLNDDN